MTKPMTPVPPRSGDDTYDLIDGALYQLAERRHRWLGDPVAAITLLASLIDQAERCLPELVTSARRDRHTGDNIAQALATSPDQARLASTRNPRSPAPDGPSHASATSLRCPFPDATLAHRSAARRRAAQR